MNKLDRPSFFDDNAALDALSKNCRLGSYPHLQGHLRKLKKAYARYIGVAGNALDIPEIKLPQNIRDHLVGHYNSPPVDLGHIATMRDMASIDTCPMCGSFHSGTLDHILPKADHAEYAVFGQNLVPACRCNLLRSRHYVGANPGERVMHPYFDEVLSTRLLTARYDDVGKLPIISIQILLAPNDANFVPVHFHLKNVVEPTGIKRWITRQWQDLILRPSNLFVELRENPETRAKLVAILQRQRDAFDRQTGSKNNWNSVFATGLLDDHVVDWLWAAFNRPGRTVDQALA